MERKEQMKHDEIDKKWSDGIRKTISEGKMQLPSDGWDRISSTLDSSIAPQNKLNQKSLTIKIGGAVAAILLLILAVNLWLKSPLDEAFDSTEPMIVAKEPTFDQKENSCVAEETEVLLSQKTSASKSRIVSVVPITLEDSLQEETKDVTDIVEGLSDSNQEMPTPSIQDKQETHLEKYKAFASENKKKSPKYYRFDYSIHLGRNFTGQSTDISANNPIPPLNDGLGDNSEGSHSQDNVISLTNNQEWNFGLSVRFMQTSRLGYETGLTYTVLSSNAKVAKDQNTRKLVLHYIGVPLHVSYSMLDTRRWQLYASCGMKAEYCISAKLGDHNFNMKDWQWSVNCAIGGQLKISNIIGLYIEHGANYYFNNHSEIMNLRTENPFNLNLNMGIRITK